MIDTVRRDLEDLLNSHRIAGDVADELPEVRNSIVTYGMPDLASIRSSVTDARARVGAAIEESDRAVRAPPDQRPRRVRPDRPTPRP